MPFVSLYERTIGGFDIARRNVSFSVWEVLIHSFIVESLSRLQHLCVYGYFVQKHVKRKREKIYNCKKKKCIQWEKAFFLLRSIHVYGVSNTITHFFPFHWIWIYAGVTKQVGDALLLEGQQRSGRVVSIGIAPWGIVERNHELLGHNRDVPCHSISSPR